NRKNSGTFLRLPMSAGFINCKKLRRIFVSTIDDPPQRLGDLKTGRAWAIKENIRHLWSYQSPFGWKDTGRNGTFGPPTADWNR
ncbi:MAG: hypothetical protein M0Z90_10505, partial [Desulfobacteraceae bacterium]|nr:hypothetical protein [Desulfobacteraceae bacterium]